MVKSTGITFDILDISRAPTVLRSNVSKLPPLARRCKCCDTPLCSFGVVVGDIDQAYEQCTKPRAWHGWLALRGVWGDKPFYIDKRDRKHVIGGTDFSKRAHNLPITMVQQAIFTFLGTPAIAAIGNKFFELGGLPMGLVLSCMCLSLNMVMVEYVERRAWHRTKAFKEHFNIPLEDVTILRYVDDIIGISSKLCGPCLNDYIADLYPWAISVSAISEQVRTPQFFEWLDYSIGFKRLQLVISKASANSQWLWHDGVRSKFSIIPYCGRQTVHLQHMRAYYICVAKTLATLQLPIQFQVMHLLTIIWEFIRLGYPTKFVVGLCICNHSLAARQCSIMVRAWFKPVQSQLG